MKTTLVLASSLLMSIPLVAGCSGDGAPSAATARATASPPVPGALRDWSRSALPVVKTRARRPVSGAPATPSVDGPIPAKYQAFADVFQAEMSAYGAPGSAVAILEHGQVTFAHGFGTKGLNSADPVDAATLFRI